MSPQDPPILTAAAQDYARLWGECTARALGQLQGATFTPTPLRSAPAAAPTAPAVPAEPAAASPAEPAAPAENLSLLFKVSGRVAGDQLFNVSKSDGVRLAQMMMAEPLDPAAAFSEGYGDALNEIFRQFAGLAATAGKAQYGGEVSFNLESGKTAEWKPAGTAIWTFTAPQVAPIQWTLLLSPELFAAIEAAHAANLAAAQAVASESPATPPVAAPAAPAMAAPLASPVPPPPPARPSFAKPAPLAATAVAAAAGEGGGSNLDLLLDVVLEATLRFGERQMLLREILELHPGSVVELNRRIQEPAELLVAGRVIAHGEVVIVDGSYGLRITDVAHPHQRLESVEA